MRDTVAATGDAIHRVRAAVDSIHTQIDHSRSRIEQSQSLLRQPVNRLPQPQVADAPGRPESDQGPPAVDGRDSARRETD